MTFALKHGHWIAALVLINHGADIRHHTCGAEESQLLDTDPQGNSLSFRSYVTTTSLEVLIEALAFDIHGDSVRMAHDILKCQLVSEQQCLDALESGTEERVLEKRAALRALLAQRGDAFSSECGPSRLQFIVNAHAKLLEARAFVVGSTRRRVALLAAWDARAAAANAWVGLAMAAAAHSEAQAGVGAFDEVVGRAIGVCRDRVSALQLAYDAVPTAALA